MSPFLSLTKKSPAWGCRTQCNILRSCSAFPGLWSCSWCRSLSQLFLFSVCLFQLPAASSPWPHLCLVPGLGWLLLSRAHLGAISSVTWHLPWAAGRHRGAPSSPSCSRELGCEPAFYRQRVPAGSGGAGGGHPSLHPGSTAPQRVLTALPHFRAVPPPHPTVSHPRRPLCPQGPGRAISQPGLPLPLPCATAPPDFPCPLSTAISREVDTELEPGAVPVRGRAGMAGHRAGPLCAGTCSAAGHTLALASASPPWLILLGSRWGSGGAGISSAALPAPQIFFLCVMFPVLIPFAFSQLSAQ